MKPYGLISDTHHHGWSAFSTVLESGVNSRLQFLLDETMRCAKEVQAVGGDMIIHAGDLFHVRGSIAPSVLNPTLDCYGEIVRSGMKVVILAGNHDLEGKESKRVSSAITALEGIGCKVINSYAAGFMALDHVVLIPWTPNIAELKNLIEKAKLNDPKGPADLDLVLHAPIDGVIPGIPDHGLSPEWLKDQGFKRVFAGHYHNHKDFGGGVYSVGALAHHTWSDVGTKAGFLIVNNKEVVWRSSRAPSFVEITAETDPDDVPLLADENYVRAKINSTKQKDVEELRAWLTDCGAKGVVILSHKEATVTKRDGATVKAGASLETSVADFIKAQSYASPEKLAILCQDILTETRSAT